MSTKKMKNITVVKVNPYEIAKASDMEFGFKSILENLSIFTNRFFNFHKPVPVDEFNKGASLHATMHERDIKDFIIGGGLVDAGKNLLSPLPIVAFSASGGLFMTNGLDVDNRPITIPIGEDFTTEGYRIESIFIGNAWTDENILGNVEKDKKDPNWDEFSSEWRASYRFSGSSTDTVFSEFKKRQMQAVRFFVYPGMIYDHKEDARASDTSSLDAFKNRVKIAEVLVHCKLDSGHFPHIQPLKDGDIRFVTAVQYWEGELGNTVNPNDIDNYNKPTAVGEDNKWVQKAKVVTANTSGMTVEQAKAEREKAAQKTLENKAFRAEHYNYLWTAEQTRTYALGSIAEISERLYKMHKSDGDIKEQVIRDDHIILECSHQHAIHGGNIHVGNNYRGEVTVTKPIALAYEPGSIPVDMTIQGGLLALAEAIRNGKRHVEQVNSALETEKRERIAADEVERKERIAADETERRGRIAADEVERKERIAADTAHQAQTHVHGATSKAEANRIAMRDGNGRMQVANPDKNDGKGVVNVDFLSREWSPDFVMKVLMSKLITNQEAFNLWINQRKNEAYTYVYLKGLFTAHHPIDLDSIGTKEVIGLGIANNSNTTISVTIYSGNKLSDAGIFGSGTRKETINNITLKVTGQFSGGIVGVRACTCNTCILNVTGDNGSNGAEAGDNGTAGCSAIGFASCTVTNCSATVTGGNGGNGMYGYDGHLFSYSGDDGGHGGNGGDVKTFDHCTLIGQQRLEKAVGGKGGNGGNGGHKYKFPTGYPDAGRAGQGGNGGKGGDVYITRSGTGIPGDGGDYGRTGNSDQKRYHGYYGTHGTIYYI